MAVTIVMVVMSRMIVTRMIVTRKHIKKNSVLQLPSAISGHASS
jgi:phage host-nuclease inhibitor protein Gam